jgi:hypothetical protein
LVKIDHDNFMQFVSVIAFWICKYFIDEIKLSSYSNWHYIQYHYFNIYWFIYNHTSIHSISMVYIYTYSVHGCDKGWVTGDCMYKQLILFPGTLYIIMLNCVYTCYCQLFQIYNCCCNTASKSRTLFIACLFPTKQFIFVL